MTRSISREPGIVWVKASARSTMVVKRWTVNVTIIFAISLLLYVAYTTRQAQAARLESFESKLGEIQTPFKYAPSLNESASLAPLRIAVMDGRHKAHDEVIGPILYTLSRFAGVKITVFRTGYRAGFIESIKSWYTGPFHKQTDFLSSKRKRRHIDDTDVLIMTTADRDLPSFFKEVDVFKDYPKLRIIAIAHRTRRFIWDERTPEVQGPVKDFPLPRSALVTLAKLIEQNRISFITLSPHVKISLRRNLARTIAKAGGSAMPPVEVYVPVSFAPETDNRFEANRTRNVLKIQPIATRASHKRLSETTVKTVVIQGTLNTWSRNYGKVFRSLLYSLNMNAKTWGYSKLRRPKRYVKSSDNAFKMLIIGHDGEGHRPHFPSALFDILDIKRDISYTEYYAQIGQADLLLPAFANSKLYLETAASASIPAAIMARVPVLASREEQAAYSYLRGPAVIFRHEGEDEIKAVWRLRKGGISIASSEETWQSYEDDLMLHNDKVVSKLLFGH